MTDPITDMLNRIKNGQAVSKTEVLVPFSKLKNEIVTVLEKQNFIGEIKKNVKGKSKVLKISLKYKDGSGAIEGLRRISKPGQRIYVSAQEIKNVRGGFGISVISTSKGLMTNSEAKKAKLGGEVLIEVW